MIDKRPRIALAHDWLCGFRGGEAVLYRIAELVRRRYEPAGLFVMFDDRRTRPDAWPRPIVSSGLSRLPGGAGALRRWLLPAYPLAVRELSRGLGAAHAQRPIDLVISTSSAAIKGLRAPPGVPHLCYCHAPARYLWSQGREYSRGPVGGLGALRGAGLLALGPALRAWDRRTAANVTAFIANSAHIAAQVRRCYGRDAAVVHPPARTGFFTPDAAMPRAGFWLYAGALEPYKRVDLAIEGAALAGAELVIAGEGSQRRGLERLARGRAAFAGRVGDEELRRLYRTARLLVFPQVEDFGIVAVEAQACGLPVVARRAGGAPESVIDGVTGAFFDEPSARAIAEAAARAPRDPAPCRAQAERFSEEAFEAAMAANIDALLDSSGKQRNSETARQRDSEEERRGR